MLSKNLETSSADTQLHYARHKQLNSHSSPTPQTINVFWDTICNRCDIFADGSIHLQQQFGNIHYAANPYDKNSSVRAMKKTNYEHF